MAWFSLPSCPSWLKQFRGVARKVATKMAAATNSATNFLMILKGLTRKGSEVATSDHVF